MDRGLIIGAYVFCAVLLILVIASFGYTASVKNSFGIGNVFGGSSAPRALPASASRVIPASVDPPAETEAPRQIVPTYVPPGPFPKNVTVTPTHLIFSSPLTFESTSQGFAVRPTDLHFETPTPGQSLVILSATFNLALKGSVDAYSTFQSSSDGLESVAIIDTTGNYIHVYVNADPSNPVWGGGVPGASVIGNLDMVYTWTAY